MIKLKTFGVYIFGGSQTIAHLQCGHDVTHILEMTEDMLDNNSYHFVKNYSNIPVLKPSEWNDNNYLEKLRGEEYDLVFANNPCSGLSSINRNAKSDQPINNRFFEVFNIISKTLPKTFLIENAPTLVSLGTPILQEMIKLLGNNYTFTIIRDKAGNHNVPMNRQRTLVVGWRRDIFNNSIPIINMNKQSMTTISEVFKGLNKSIPNMELEKDTCLPNLTRFYSKVKSKDTILRALVKEFDDIKNDLTDSEKKLVLDYKTKQKENKNIWDKTAYRLDNNYTAPSMTSMSQFIHPIEDRELYIREYARIMGYPDNFIFYPNECKCSTIQCLAQGVPVNFIKYISNEIKRCLTTDYKYIENVDVTFQNHSKQKLYSFTKEEFLELKSLLHTDKEGIKIH